MSAELADGNLSGLLDAERAEDAELFETWPRLPFPPAASLLPSLRGLHFVAREPLLVSRAPLPPLAGSLPARVTAPADLAGG